LEWRLSITMEAPFCVATLKDALARHGRPGIFNTDHGSQFTGAAFSGRLTRSLDYHRHIVVTGNMASAAIAVPPIGTKTR
jgi:transposase InsO family protein